MSMGAIVSCASTLLGFSARTGDVEFEGTGVCHEALDDQQFGAGSSDEASLSTSGSDDELLTAPSSNGSNSGTYIQSSSSYAQYMLRNAYQWCKTQYQLYTQWPNKACESTQLNKHLSVNSHAIAIEDYDTNHQVDQERGFTRLITCVLGKGRCISGFAVGFVVVKKVSKCMLSTMTQGSKLRRATTIGLALGVLRIAQRRRFKPQDKYGKYQQPGARFAPSARDNLGLYQMPWISQDVARRLVAQTNHHLALAREKATHIGAWRSRLGLDHMPYHLHHLRNVSANRNALQSPPASSRSSVSRLCSWSKGKENRGERPTQSEQQQACQKESLTTVCAYGSVSSSWQQGSHTAAAPAGVKFKLTDQYQWPAMEAAQRFRAMSEVIGVSLTYVNDDQGVAVLWVQVANMTHLKRTLCSQHMLGPAAAIMPKQPLQCTIPAAAATAAGTHNSCGSNQAGLGSCKAGSSCGSNGSIAGQSCGVGSATSQDHQGDDGHCINAAGRSMIEREHKVVIEPGWLSACSLHMALISDWLWQVRLPDQPLQQGRWIQVIDLKGVRISDCIGDALAVIRSIMGTAHNFPQRLRLSLVINPPAGLALVWAMVAKLLPGPIVEKIKIVRGSRSAIHNELIKYMPADLIPEACGGACALPMFDYPAQKDLQGVMEAAVKLHC